LSNSGSKGWAGSHSETGGESGDGVAGPPVCSRRGRLDEIAQFRFEFSVVGAAKPDALRLNLFKDRASTSCCTSR
jgi:hypothetical protein